MKCLATNSQIKKIKSEMETEYKQREDIFRKQTIEFYATVFVIVLTDKYGIGKQKIHQILKTFVSLTEELAGDEIKLAEIKETLLEEYDIDINKEVTE